MAKLYLLPGGVQLQVVVDRQSRLVGPSSTAVWSTNVCFTSLRSDETRMAAGWCCNLLVGKMFYSWPEDGCHI